MGTPALATELSLSPTNVFTPVNHIFVAHPWPCQNCTPAPSISLASRRASQYVGKQYTPSVRDRRDGHTCPHH
eukprot:2472969-Rhodomonas_salina.1